MDIYIERESERDRERERECVCDIEREIESQKGTEGPALWRLDVAFSKSCKEIYCTIGAY